MKRHLLFKSLLLLCALVVGTSAWATDEIVTIASSTDVGTGTTASSSNSSVTKGDITISCTSGGFAISGGAHYRLGSGSTTTISTSNGTIKSIVINGPAGTGSNSISKFGTNTGWTLDSKAGTYTWSGNAASVTVTAHNGQVRPTSFVVTYTPAASGNTVITPTISPASGAVVSGTEVTLTCATEGASIYYTMGNNPADPTSSSTLYNPSSKPTITAATTIKAIGIKDGLTNSAVATADYTIAIPCATPTFSVAAGAYTEAKSVEIACATEGATIHYTTDGTVPTSSSPTYSSALSVRTDKTIKAIAIKDGYANSNIAEASYTFYVVLPFEWDNTSTPIGVTNNNVGTYTSSPYLKFDATGDYIILKFNEVPGTLTFDILGNSFSGGTFKVQTSADGETYTDLKSYTSLSTSKQSESFVNEIASNVRYIKWIYTSKDKGNVALGNIKLTSTVDVTIASSSGFATLYTGRALDFSTLSSELKAYTATVSENTVTLTEVANIPANTGVVLKGTQTTHAVPVSASSSTAQGDLTGNTSAATAYNAFSGYDLYMLALIGEDKAQFTLVNKGSIAAGKAFLKLANSGSGARELNVVFADDEATGVADVRCKMADGRNDFYNLNGQKVLNPTKGLYIVNGKKVVIK